MNEPSSKLLSCTGLLGLITWQFWWADRMNLVDSDSRYMAALAIKGIRANSPAMGLRNEFLLGFSDLQWGILHWLDPVSLAGVIGFVAHGGNPSSALEFDSTIAAIIAVILVWWGTVYLSRSFHISKRRSTINGLLAAAMTIGPGLVPVILPDQYRLVPTYATLSSVTMLAIGAVERMAERNWRMPVLTFMLSLIYLTLVIPYYLPLALFVVTTVGVPLVVHQKIGGRRWWTAVLTASVLACIAVLLGLVSFIRGLFGNVAVVQLGEFFVWRYESIRPLLTLPFRVVFVSPDAVALALFLMLLLISWVSLTLFGRPSRERGLALSVLVYIAAITAYRASQRWWTTELGPTHLYIAWVATPLISVGVVGGLSCLRRLVPHRKQVIMSLSGLVVFLLGVVSSWPSPTLVTSTKKEEAVWKRLADETSLSGSPEFRGRTAVVMSVNTTGPVWPDTYFPTDTIISHQIPMLNTYSHLQSPMLFRFGREFLFREEDPGVRHLLAIRRINQRILGMLGVRYVITDSVVLNSTYREIHSWTTMAGNKSVTLRLLEDETYNDGSYSPTDIRTTSDQKSALSILADSSFDPAQSAVIGVGSGDLGSLSEARNVSLRYEGGDLRVRATSDSTSILVIPVEYSHCWSVKSRSESNDEFRLLRVNVLQLGFIFSGTVDADLRYRFWPTRNSDCRLKDLQDYRNSFEN